MAITLIALMVGSAGAATLELKKGDHVCIIGNALAERMQHFGWLEALIHARFPQHELVFRNLAYSGDEIDGWQAFEHRLRSMSFGSQDEWLSGNSPIPQPDKLGPRDAGKNRENRFELTNTKADVVFAFYGYNESWAGEAGLDKFKENVKGFIEHTLSQKYNGQSAPRLVLFSPIAQEYLNDPNLPSREEVAKVNQRIETYVRAMQEVAKAADVTFVDLFTATKQSSATPLTINGIHQTDAGDHVIARAAVSQLFGENTSAEPAVSKELLLAVNDKNFYWYNRYRVTDGYSTYGDRAFLKFAEGPGGYGDGLSNYTVVQRELEVLDSLTSAREQRVWDLAQGKKHADQEAPLPEYVPVISNKPGTLEGGMHAFLSGEEAISKMTIAKGLKVQLFATEQMFPEMENPVQMAFDAKGRLWVACWPTYPHWKPTDPMNDKLVILEDTDHDGTADTCKTFVGDLHNPTGFEFWNNGVIVAQGPDLIYLRDTNGDDTITPADDVRIRLLHGLDTADTHHTANSFALDPGGALYFQEGTFHHTQVESVWGPPRRVANGAVFRYEPRAQKFDVYVSYGFANPHGHIFDEWGQDIVWDGTGAQPYHAALFSGSVDFPHKHGGTPQVYQQRTRPCSGTEVLYSSHFPEDWRGNLLVLNVIGFQGILRYKVEDKDSSFTAVEQEPLLFSSDPNFRPTDIEAAPDGSIYFVDWQNPIIGHMQHNLRDPSRDHTHGRVYRITHEGHELIPAAPIAGETLATLLELLKSPEGRVRHRTRIELSGRNQREVIRSLESWLKGLDSSDPNFEHHRLEGLWVYQNQNVVNVDLLKQVLRSPDFHARAAATRVLCYWRDRVDGVLDLLATQVNDEHPRVRLEAIRTLSFFRGEQAKQAQETAVQSLAYPQDMYLEYLLKETLDTLDRAANVGS